MTLNISTSRPGFFANDHRELLKEWPQVTNHLALKCPETTNVLIDGTWRGRIVYKATASASAWLLSQFENPLQIALEDVDKQSVRFEDTRQLDGIVRKYSEMLGGTDAPDVKELSARVEQRKTKLLDERYESYLRDLRSIPQTLVGLDLINTVSNPLFRDLERRYPASMSRFQDAKEERAKAVQAAVVAEIRKELERPMSSWREAVDRLALIQERENSLINRIPDISDAARGAREKVNQELDKYQASFRDYLVTLGDDWNALTQLNAEKQKLNRASTSNSSLDAYVPIIDARRVSVLTKLEERSVIEFATMGENLSDMEAVLDRGAELAKNFTSMGQSEAATRVKKAFSDRVSALANQSYDAFAKDVNKLPSSIDSRNQLLTVLEEYEALEDAVPAFSRYADLADERISAMEAQACAGAALTIGNTSLLTQSISLKEGPQSFRDFACNIALAGHKLGHVSSTWSWITNYFTGNFDLEFTSANGESKQITLKPKSDVGTQLLVGHTLLTLDGEPQTLTETEWHELAVSMVKASPSGRPDADGRTECDLLAADPDDPKKKALGVKDELLDVNLGLEACIAAVEIQTGDPAQVYQLGRVLKRAGNEELARHYLQFAGSADYAAAFAKLGDIDAVYEDKTEPALENYKRAARGGYEPAKQQVALLSIGEPIDFSKEPPTSGSFKLLCLVENTSYTVGGDLHDVWMSELTANIDLDSNTVEFEYDKIAAYNDRNLLERGRTYKLSTNDQSWLVPVAEIGGEAGSYSLTIGRRTLRADHRQPMILGNLFGIPLRASMTVTGECMQSF